MKRRKSFFEKDPIHLKKIDSSEEEDEGFRGPLFLYLCTTVFMGAMLWFGLWFFS